MPYHIVSVDGGYKVAKKQPGKRVYLSKKPLSKTMAERQLRALYLAENLKG